MAENKSLVCSVCGSHMLQRKDSRTAVCKACGNTIVISDTVSAELISLLSAGSVELKVCDFDKAKEYFSQAAKCDPQAAEAFWGVFLAKYGIEYVYDPKTGRNIPTCHRASAVSVFDDSDFKRALALSQGTQNEYREKGEEIERIRKEIVEIAAKKEPYDIFICYKATYEENGKQYFTKDRELAKDIYHELDKQNYKVFFAEETLRNFAGEDYEPVIYSALTTAAVMLVVTTSLDHLESVWVKNEWSRFLENCAYDQNRKLVVVLKDLSPSALPPRLKNLQALDASRYAFADDLRALIEKATAKRSKAVLERKQIAEKNYVKNLVYHTEKIIKRTFERREQGSVTPTEEGLLRNADKFLSMGNFKKAYKLYQNAVAENPNAVRAHWGLLLAETESKNTDEFIKNAYRFWDFETIRNVFNCAPSEASARGYLSDFKRATLHAAMKSGSKAPEMFRECAEWMEEEEAFKLSTDIAKEAECFIGYDLKWGKRLFDASLIAIAQEKADEYVLRNLTFANALRNEGLFSDAQSYFAKALEVDRGSQEAMWGIYLCEQKIAKQNQAAQKIKHASQVASAEKILAYDVSNPRIYEFFIAAAKEHVRKDRVQKGVNIFDAITALIPTQMNSYYRKQLLQFADLLLVVKAFKFAKKYYVQLLSYDMKDPEAHWGILKVKLRATSDYDLTLRKRELSDYPEFMNTVNCNGEASDYYMRFLDEQTSLRTNSDKRILYSGYKRRAEKTKTVPVFGQGDKLFSYDQFNSADNTGNRSIRKSETGQPFSQSDKKHLGITFLLFVIALGVQTAFTLIGFYSFGGDYETFQIVIAVLFGIGGLIAGYLVSHDFWKTVGSGLVAMLIGAGVGYGFGMLFTDASPFVGVIVGGVVGVPLFIIGKIVISVKSGHRVRLSDKFLSIFCVLLMGFYIIASGTAIVPALYRAQDNTVIGTYEKDGLTYNEHPYYSVLTGAKKKVESLRIPHEINGKPVKKIKKEAFAENRDIRELIMGRNVTEIEEKAFYNCYALNFVNCDRGDQLETIGKKAFYGCVNLTVLTLPENLKSIEEEAFSGCKFYSLTLPPNLLSIGNEAFYNCAFEEVEIPSSVEYIGGHAFGLSRLNRVRFHTPRTLLNIAGKAFYVSHALTADFTSCSMPPNIGEKCFSNDVTILVRNHDYNRYYGSGDFFSYRSKIRRLR